MSQDEDPPGFGVAPHFANLDFDVEPNFEQTVLLFADTVWGWQLDRAEEQAGQPLGDFAAISVMISYFEMIASYRDGVLDGRGQSAALFKRGVEWVLGEGVPGDVATRFATRLYDAARNGLYHEGLTREGIVLSRALPERVVLLERRGPDGGTELAVDPVRLAGQLKRHFARYVLALLNPANTALRAAFAKRSGIDPPE